MKRMKIFSVLLIIIILATACNRAETLDAGRNEVGTEQAQISPTENSNIESSPLELLGITLPDGLERYPFSEVQDDFLMDGSKAGGILSLDCDETVFDDVQNYLVNVESLVMKAMESAGVTNMEWKMGGSSIYSLYEFEMGNGQSEYIAYFFRGVRSCYVVWFDKNLVTEESISVAISSIDSEDITEDLNKVSSEDFMDAINKDMEGKRFRFNLELPEGVIQQDISDDGAIFYRDKTLIGGYQTVHFEEGILPFADENHSLILDRLKEAAKHQVDLTDYAGEMTSKSPITVVFKNGEKEYIHYIHYFGQIGTQYDVWFDTSMVDEMTRLTIFATAKLIELS